MAIYTEIDKMERDSFIFYRSFWSAIKVQSKEIQQEVLQCVIEYALEGKLPQDAGPITLSMFALMRPVIDRNNTRFANGKKGGRPPRRSTAAPNTIPPAATTAKRTPDARKGRGRVNSHRPATNPAVSPEPARPAPSPSAPSLSVQSPLAGSIPESAAGLSQVSPPPAQWSSFQEEIAWLHSQPQWAESFRRTFSLSEEDLKPVLDAFLLHCQTERDPADLHRDPSDLRRHISSWMRIAKPTNTPTDEKPATAKTPQRKPRSRKATDPSNWTPNDFSSEI